MEYLNLYGEMALRLSLALFAGIVLGLNRWVHHKSAGIRTHSLAAIGSATAVMSIGYLVKPIPRH
jgi:putative Mg2+ transporter-C (MgtC) family protein